MSLPSLPLPRPRKWKAKWIWPATIPIEESNVYCYFRKTFDLGEEPDGHSLFVSADRLYELFVNGIRLGKGPPPSQPWFHYYDEYDLSNTLRKGRNCIAAVVYHVAESFGDVDGRGRGGFLLEVTDARNTSVLRTDGTWRARLADAWDRNTPHYGNVVAPHVESFDAGLEPEGWREAGFDDRQWRHAGVIRCKRRPDSDAPPAAGPWSKLVPRDIPFMQSQALLPHRVERADESLDIQPNTTNIAPGLSMTGKPVQYTRCESPEHLCKEDGFAVFGSSLEHLNLDFGSVYSPAVVLDFGRVITAHVKITIEGVAGGIIDIGYAERLIDGQFNINISSGSASADRYIMKDGHQVFETFTWKAFRFLKLRFRGCAQPVKVHNVHAMVSTYPYEERGSFVSDDETLNGVFGICKATIRLCSNDFLMDTPWREKAQWLGDCALVTLPAIHSCFGDTALPRKFLMQAGQHQFPTGLLANVSNFNSLARARTWTKAIPDYSLWWIGGLLDQFLYAGDEALLHRLYPQALRILDTHLDYLNESTLIEDMPYWVLIDWADVEKSGICAAYNAIFYRALGCLNQLAEYKGDAYTADLTRALRSSMKTAFHAALFDESRGCYADANIGGRLSDKISEHGNMTPIWAGLCERDMARELVSKIFPENGQGGLTFTEAQPFYMAVVLPALAGVGRFDLALDLIRRRWGRRMLDIGATSTFECWQQDGRWTSGSFVGLLNSHSHAWSACPADFLIRHILGLKILEPGCKTLQLAPECTDFNYEVAFPTPLGSIRAECRDGTVSLSCPDAISVATGTE